MGDSSADDAMLEKLKIAHGTGRLLSKNLPKDVRQTKMQHARDSAADHVMSSHNLIAKLNFLLKHTMFEVCLVVAVLRVDC